MIGNIVSSSSSIQVFTNGGSNYINGYAGSQGVGNIRFNTSNQSMEVYNGQNWQTLSLGSTSVSLSGEAESLLNWARQKRAEEEALEKLAETNPTIKDLVEQIKMKQDQIKMVQTLLNSPGNEIKPSMVP